VSAPAIDARGVVKTFRDGERIIRVLREVDLRVETGELVAIVGPSGSGKSTLLHLLGGLERADAGQIEVAGRDLARTPRGELADFRNRHLGFVFQFHQLLPDFTALENVTMPGRIAGLGTPDLLERGLRLLSEVGLEERRDSFPGRLSGGERQRIAICRALFLEPALLLADEPTGNLDPASGERVLELLLDMRARRGTTCVLVTHNPKLAERCGRVLVLREGRLEAITEQGPEEGVSTEAGRRVGMPADGS
jgi:ABC-type lipoprotein export system ATPase subunit